MLHETLSLTPDITAPALARRQLRDLLRDQPANVVDDLLLMTTEVLTNSVRYSPVGTDGHIHLAVSVSDRVRVEVTDPGTGDIFTPHLADPDEQGGRGLLLVAELAGRWGIERSSATTVWFELLLAARVESCAG